MQKYNVTILNRHEKERLKNKITAEWRREFWFPIILDEVKRCICCGGPAHETEGH